MPSSSCCWPITSATPMSCALRWQRRAQTSRRTPRNFPMIIRAASEAIMNKTTTTRHPIAAPRAGVQDKAMLTYQSGFGNEFASEALPGALPVGQNSPQRAPYGLYAEQLSGTAFTAPRSANRRSWTYRIRPAAMHLPFRRIGNGRIESRFGDVPTPPNQLRWDPLPIPASATDFIDGLVTMAGNGDPAAMSGCGIHVYAANRSMHDRFFY